MGYWSTRGLRGSFLEELINQANDIYMQKGLAVVQKVPTPITPVEIEKSTGRISLAYFDKKSTVDYIGVIQGIPVCFDAKETNLKSLPMKNIHKHQIEFMQAFCKQDGIPFLLVYFKVFDETYFLPFEVLLDSWNEFENGGRKSIPYDKFDKKYLIRNKDGCIVHYLEAFGKYLQN